MYITLIPYTGGNSDGLKESDKGLVRTNPLVLNKFWSHQCLQKSVPNDEETVMLKEFLSYPKVK